MATIQGLYAEAFNVTATDTNQVDVCSISSGSFTAGNDYLIIASAIISSTASSIDQAQVRLVHGTTPTAFTDASLSYELSGSDAQETNASWCYIFTQPGTPETVKIQVSSETTSDMKCEMGQIFALNLTQYGTLNTHYYTNEVTADYTTTASKVAQASITFTPNGTDDWLIIGNFMQVPGSASANYLADINDSVAGVLTSLDMEGEDITNDLRGHTLMAVVTPTNASHTFTLRFAHETTAGTVASSRIFALNLNTFSQHSFSFAAAADTPAASPSWTTTRTVAPTPTNTGNWFAWGYFGNDVGTLTDSLGVRLQIDAAGGGLTSDPAYGDDAPKADSWDATDVVPFHIFKMESLSNGGSRTINLDVQMITGTTLRAVDRTLVAFALETVSAATPSATLLPRSPRAFMALIGR